MSESGNQMAPESLLLSLKDSQIWSQNQRSSMILTEKKTQMKMATVNRMATQMMSETEN